MTVMFDNVHHPHVGFTEQEEKAVRGCPGKSESVAFQIEEGFIGLYDFIEISRELVKKHDETELTVILWSFMERHWTIPRHSSIYARLRQPHDAKAELNRCSPGCTQYAALP